MTEPLDLLYDFYQVQVCLQHLKLRKRHLQPPPFTFTADATHLAGEAAPLRWQGNSAAENAQQLKEKDSNTLPLH